MPALGSPEFDEFASSSEFPLVDASATLDAGDLPPLSIDVEPGAPSGAPGDVSRALGAAAKALGVPVPLPVRVAVRAGGLCSGMGTSAALGTALSRALLAWYSEAATIPRVLPGAEAVEELFHANPSGVDHTVSVYETPVWFQKETAPIPLPHMRPLDLVLLPRVSDKSTGEVVDGVRAAIVADPLLIRVIAEMGRWSRDGRAAWQAGDVLALGEAMRRQQRSLDRIGVVNDTDREGVARATDAGAIAAKITGAGWGGTLLALVDDAHADAVLAAWGAGAVRVRVG
jgi:mevalonate kinase